MKKILAMTIILAVIISLAACSGSTQELNAQESAAKESPEQTPSEQAEENETENNSEDSYPMTIVDYLGYDTTLEKPPERVAVLSGTPLNIWYDLGGKSICTSNISENLKIYSLSP